MRPFCILVIYSYLQIRQAKLHNFYLSKVLLEQAYVDALTDIPNRRSFMAKAERQLRLATPGQYLALIDIDNFKRVNDRFGHDVGDEVREDLGGGRRQPEHGAGEGRSSAV